MQDLYSTDPTQATCSTSCRLYGSRYDMLRRICIVQIQARQHVLGHAGYTAPTGPRELDGSHRSGIYQPCLADDDNQVEKRCSVRRTADRRQNRASRLGGRVSVAGSILDSEVNPYHSSITIHK